MNLPNNPTYSSGRTVKARNLQYLSRPADEEILAYCRNSQPAFILTSPHMGKSSIIARTAERLKKEKTYHPVIIDLSQFPLPPRQEEWFQKILFLLENHLDLSEDSIDWLDRHSSLPFPERLTTFLEEVVLAEIHGSLVLLFDEIEQTLSCPFRGELFSWLSSLYEARSTHPIFQRISFVLCGVATPRQLIPNNTPPLFEWAQEVVLSDFSLEEVLPLADSLSLPDETGKTVIEWVYQWTKGHPYLTQLLCQVIEEQRRSAWNQAEVGACIQNFLISPQGIQDRNLQIVRCALTEPTYTGTSLLQPYLQLLEGQGEPLRLQSVTMEALRLAGVVRETADSLTVRNQVYQTAFPADWVKSHLPKSEKPVTAVLPKPYVIAASLLLLGLGFAFGSMRTPTPPLPESSATSRPELETPEAPSPTPGLIAALGEKETAIAQADHKIQELETTLKQYQTLNNLEEQQMTAQLSALQDKFEKKTDALEKAKLSIQEMESRLQNFEKTENQALANLKLERDQFERKYSSTRNELEQSTNQLKELQTALLKQSTLSPSEVNKLISDRSQLETNLKTANRELGKTLDRNRELESLLGQQKQVTATEVKRQADSLNRLETQLHEKEADLERSRQDFKKTEQTFKEQLRLSQTELARIQEDRSQLQNQIATHKQELGEYRERLARLEMTSSQQRQTLDLNRKEHEQLTNQIQELTARETTLHSQLNQSQNELQNSKNQVTALTSQVSQVKKDEENRLTAIQNIQTTSRELSQRTETQLAELLKSRNTLETQLEEAQETLRQTQARVHQLESEGAQYASLQKDIQRLSTERDQFSSQLKQANQQLDRANQEVKNLQATQKRSTIPSSSENQKSASAISGALPTITSALTNPDRFPKEDFTRLLWARQAYLFGVRSEGTQWATIDHVLRDGLHASPVSFSPVKGRINALAFHPLGGKLVSGTSDGNVLLWNTENPQQTPKNFPGHSAGVLTIAYSPDGKFLASGSHDTSIRLYSMDSPDAPPQVLNAHIKGVTSLAFSPDGKTLASASQDHTIRLWDLASKSPGNTTLGTHAGWVNAIAFTPDGRFLLSAGDDLTVRMWDVRHPEVTPRILQGHTQSISTLAIHPFGSILASGGRDQRIALWDLRDPLAPPQYLIGHAGRVSQLQFSPDGDTLISVSSDKTMRVWDWQHPSVAPTILSNQKDSLDAVAIKPDGSQIATGGAQKVITMWAATPKLVETVCEGVQRNLTLSEWQELVGNHLPYERTCTNLPLHPSLLEEAKTLAKKGEVAKALKFFERAKSLDSSLDLDPKKEVEKLAAKS